MAVNQTQMKSALHQYFGFTEFRDGQEQVLESVFNKRDTLAVLPTGAGKTLLYQLPGYLMDGSVIIVSPLLSLMQDQVSRLHERGEKNVVMLSSLQTPQQRRTALNQLGRNRFIFASPEVLAQERVITALMRTKISLFVVDEAHCVSQWGPDFRPHYLMLKQLLVTLGHPTVLMLTATATKRVQDDVIAKLGLVNQRVTRIIKSVNRDNIYLAVERSASRQDKEQRLLKLVTSIKGAGIIYFSSRKQASQFATWLAEQTGMAVAAYHAGIGQIDRYKIQHQFMNNQLDVVCATNAFGMGIDKDDIRFVIHYHLPANLENYVQEIGRAGRDGRQSIAILMYLAGDEQIPRQLNALTLPTNEVITAFMNHLIKADSLGEMGELLTYYLNAGYSVEQVQSIFQARTRQSSQNLTAMLAYLSQTECLRNYILGYFNEPSQPHEEKCCDCEFDDADLEQLGLKAPVRLAQPAMEPSINWQTRLNALFFVKS